jgi:hypothetical protein
MVKEVPYAKARKLLRNGDTFLVAADGRSLDDAAISAAGRSPYKHAGKVVRWYSRLMAVDTIQGVGGRAISLSRLVAENPGRVLIRRIRDPKYDRVAACKAMIGNIDRPYGSSGLVRAATVHIPFWRFWAKADTDDQSNGSDPFCSQAVAAADRAGGVDPVPNLADGYTEPGDIARSAAYSDLFILT